MEPQSILLRFGPLRWILILLLLVRVGGSSQAQTAAERLAFDAAVRSLQAGFAEKAANDLAEFIRQNPESPLAAEAILLEARARADLGQLDGAPDVECSPSGSADLGLEQEQRHAVPWQCELELGFARLNGERASLEQLQLAGSLELRLLCCGGPRR